MQSTNTRAQKSGYLPTLDGWRAVAIACVIFSHARQRIGQRAEPFGIAGSYAVDLFFVLSGYLICTRLLAEESKSGNVSLRGFYIRRFFRLQPAALTYLACVALLGLLGLIPIAWKSLAFSAVALQNFYIGGYGGYSPDGWYTAHFWSLAAEEHFYLVFPALFLLVRKARLAFWSGMLIALLVWHHVLLSLFRSHSILANYKRTDFVSDTMALGVVTALLLQRPAVLRFLSKWLHPALAVTYAAVVFTFLQIHQSTYSREILISVYPVLLVSTQLHAGSALGRLLEKPAFRYVGHISYSAYLWQQLFFREKFTAPPGQRLNGWLCLLCLFAIASASYYWIEKPSIRLGHRLANRFQHS